MFLPNRKDAVHKAWLYRVLREIADDNFLASVLYFKGGTCAAMRGLLDRFSVDLDFDFVGKKSEMSQARENLEKIFKQLGLEIKDSSKVAVQYFLRYPAQKDCLRNILKIDTFFPPLESNKYEAVRLVDINRIFYCQTVETMLANKMVALIDRYKKRKAIAGRDLYDLYYFFLQGYHYDTEIIEKYTGKKTIEFLYDLVDIIEKKITQKIIDQDLNFLLPPQKFQRIRKILKDESLILLRDEIKRLKLKV